MIMKGGVRKEIAVVVLVMGFVVGAAAAVTKSGAVRPAAGGPAVVITSPKEGASVGDTVTVNGRVVPQNGKVCVAVRPIPTNEYYLQWASVTNGDWQVKARIGRIGQQDAGKWFEITAILNPCSRRVWLH